MTLTEKAKFDFIRYANVWEDASVLAAALQIQAGEKVLSIASAGDNCFYLLKDQPSLVVAADLSEAQLHLVALKKTAIKHLSRNEVLNLLGFTNNENPLEVYEKIKQSLPTETREYWDNNHEAMLTGLHHGGKFEKYFQTFSQRILPFIHSKKKVEKLLKVKSAAEQKEFYNTKWNTWRWRLLFKLFFSKKVMGWLGRDPEFLRQVEINVADFIFSQAEKQLSSKLAHNNHMLRYNLTGDFGSLLPEYLREENFLEIKTNIDAIQTFKGYAQEAGVKYGKFDAMNLSNIFEYMNPDIFSQTGKALLNIAKPGARIAYWNLMVPRKLSSQFSDLEHLEELGNQLAAEDKGFYYYNFIIEKLNSNG